MLGSIVKSTLFMLIASATLSDSSQTGKPEKQADLAVIKFTSKPETKALLHQKSTRKRPRKVAKQSIYKSQTIKISGYLGRTFVYGEVIPLENGIMEGYLYHPKRSKTYVYGEQVNDKINLYDTNGNLYQVIRQ